MKISSLPEINFITESLEDILTRNISEYEEAYYQETGERITLYPGNKMRIYIYSKSLREFQYLYLINEMAKSNLLKYASMDVLKHMGALFNIEPLAAKKAVSYIKITLSKTFDTTYNIPEGTRFTPGNQIYFETIAQNDIAIGETETVVSVQCTTPGLIGNDFLAGQINILVDPLPFVASVSNTVASSGGADEEDTESFRESIRTAPSTLSVAGPAAGYEAMAKGYSTEILDAHADSVTPGVVRVAVAMKSGVPSAEELTAIKDHLMDKYKRPLTDNVEVIAAPTTEYSINYTYFISLKDALIESEIQTKVTAATEAYKTWQAGALGRNINPSKLYSLIMSAGASRIVLTAPSYLEVDESSMPNCISTDVVYGGIEDDGSL